MQDAIERIEADLKEIKSEQKKQGETLAVNTSQLATHIKRTDLLETYLHGMPQKALILISIVAGVIGIASHLIK